jgi:hypothetical protein
MGKSSKQSADGCARIKGYLPVRVKIPEQPVGGGDSKDDDEETSNEHDNTFFFVREHRDKNSGASSKQGNTLFVANAPVVPGIKTKLLLKCIMGLVENPRQQHASATHLSADWKPFFPSFQGPIHASEKFAHVVFASNKHMRKTLQAMEDVMARNDDADLPGIQLNKLDLTMLREETDRLHREEMGCSDSEDNDDIVATAQKATGIVA